MLTVQSTTFVDQFTAVFKRDGESPSRLKTAIITVFTDHLRQAQKVHLCPLKSVTGHQNRVLRASGPLVRASIAIIDEAGAINSAWSQRNTTYRPVHKIIGIRLFSLFPLPSHTTHKQCQQKWQQQRTTQACTQIHSHYYFPFQKDMRNELPLNWSQHWQIRYSMILQANLGHGDPNGMV